MMFQTSRDATKHVFLALGVHRTAMQECRARRLNSLGFRPSIPRYIGSSIAKPHKTSSECCQSLLQKLALRYLMFDVDLTQRY